jgi:hypothetical protein
MVKIGVLCVVVGYDDKNWALCMGVGYYEKKCLQNQSQ